MFCEASGIGLVNVSSLLNCKLHEGRNWTSFLLSTVFLVPSVVPGMQQSLTIKKIFSLKKKNVTHF